MRRLSLVLTATGAAGAIAVGAIIALQPPTPITVSGTINRPGRCVTINEDIITSDSRLTIAAHDDAQLAYTELSNYRSYTSGIDRRNDYQCQFWFRLPNIEGGRGPYRLEIGKNWSYTFDEDRSEMLNLQTKDGRLVNGN